MVDLLLTGAGVFTFAALNAYARPFRPCPRCTGTGRQHKGDHHRTTPCRRCSGTGHIPRAGARTAHRAVLSVRAELARQQKRKDR